MEPGEASGNAEDDYFPSMEDNPLKGQNYNF